MRCHYSNSKTTVEKLLFVTAIFYKNVTILFLDSTSANSADIGGLPQDEKREINDQFSSLKPELNQQR